MYLLGKHPGKGQCRCSTPWQIPPIWNAWIRALEKLIPAQKMGYSVIEAPDRADLIAYLKKLPKP